MTELTRYNAVPRIIGQDMNVEFEAADDGQWVEADGAVTEIKKLKDEAGILRLKYALCDSDVPAEFEPELEPIERIMDYAAQRDEEFAALKAALEGLLARHCDGSDERHWAEWDTATEVLARKEAK